MFFHALIVGHIVYSALCLFQNSSTLCFFGKTDELGVEMCILGIAYGHL